LATFAKIAPKFKTRAEFLLSKGSPTAVNAQDDRIRRSIQHHAWAPMSARRHLSAWAITGFQH